MSSSGEFRAGLALVLLAQVYAVASDSVVLSPTHPDSEAWYFTRHFQAHWPAYHPAATGYRWSIDQQPDTPVAEDATLAGSLEIDVAVDADGSWYLHLAAVDAAGIIAGSQIDYRFNVHTAPPTITSPSHPDSGTTMSRSEFQAQARLPRDGNTWTSVVGSAGEPVVFKGKIWRFERSTFSNANIWWSDDGMQWNYVDVHPGLPLDWRVKVLVHEGAIWLFGSQGLWRSEDGIRWTEFGPAGGWRKYRRFAVASFAGKLWVLGGDVEVMGSDWYTGKPILYHDVNDFVWSSEDGVHWDMQRAPWPARSSAIAAVYNNQLWIMGGSPSDYDYKALTDIWSTEDGQTWVRRAGVAPVAIADPLVFQDKLWLIRAGATMPHTIWCTSDGSTWTQSDGLATKIVYDTCGLAPVVFQGEFWAFTTGTDGGTNTFRSANGFNWTPVSLPYWRPRASHGSTVFKDQLWITGGTDGTVLNDVWSSTDGIAWDQVTPAAPWPPRSEHGTAVFADKLWVMGGTDGNAWLKDVWQSADGKEWSLVTENAPFSKVRGQAFVFRNRLWLVGDNNLWYTGDGAHWAAVPQDPPWKRDSGLKVAVLNDRLYLCAGSTQSSTEYELWVSIDGVSWQKFEIAQGSKSITSFQNEIWLLGMRQYFLRGGYYPMPEYIDDYNQQIVRFDPLSGVTADTNAPAWRIRTSHAATAFDGTLWVLGGSPISGDIVWHLGSEALPVYKYRYTVDTMPDTVPTASAASSTLGRFNVPGNTLGEHWFHVAAVDALDNATAPAHYRFVVGNGPPVVMSPSHPDTVRGYTGQEVTFFWSSGEETDTRCYYYSVDQSANGIPNQMTTDTSLSLTCLEPGTYWLHLARLSTSGLASEIVHHQIIVAGGPTPLITSVSHPTEGTPYVARTVSLNWSYPYQPYACHYVWDQEPLTDPDQDSPQTSDTTLVIENAPVGVFYLHVRTVDACGRWGDTAHFTVFITVPDPPILTLWSEPTPGSLRFKWTDPGKFATGTPPYYAAFDTNPDTIPGPEDIIPDGTTFDVTKPPEGLYYFHVKGQDVYGNPSPVSHLMISVGELTIAVSGPSKPSTSGENVVYRIYHSPCPRSDLQVDRLNILTTGSATYGEINEDGSTYEKWVTIWKPRGVGTISIELQEGAFLCGGLRSAATARSVPVYVNTDPKIPTVQIGSPTRWSTNGTPVSFWVMATGATSSELRPEHVRLLATGSATAEVAVVNAAPHKWHVRLNNISGSGELAIAIAAGVAIGSDGSLSWAAGPSEVVKVDPKSFALRMESYGSGTVNPGAGQYQFPDGTEITLQAVADYPDIGIRWMVDGVGSWSNECRLAMNQDHHVEVWFEERPRHSADTQWDWEFQLSELLRVIQCYNALGIRCAELSAPTEDGYRPGTSGSTNCAPHSSDYYPQDWKIDLGELLRLIQFYNAPGFDVCADSEDGFCAIE